MIRALGPANVVHSYVGNNLLHGGELFQAGRPILELLTSLHSQQGLCVNRRLLWLRRRLLLLVVVVVFCAGNLAAEMLMMMLVLVLELLMMLLVLVMEMVLRMWLLMIGSHLVRGGDRRLIVATGGVHLGTGGRYAANMINRSASIGRAAKVGSLIGGCGGGCRNCVGRIVLLLGRGCRLGGGQLGLLLLLQFGRQLNPKTGVGTLGRRLVSVILRRILLLLLLLMVVEVAGRHNCRLHSAVLFTILFVSVVSCACRLLISEFSLSQIRVIISICLASQ